MVHAIGTHEGIAAVISLRQGPKNGSADTPLKIGNASFFRCCLRWTGVLRFDLNIAVSLLHSQAKASQLRGLAGLSGIVQHVPKRDDQIRI